MGAKEGTYLAYCERDSFLGLLPREHAYLGVRRKHRALHGDGVWVRGNFVRQHQNRVLARAHELARHREDEVGIGLEHPNHELLGHLYRDVGTLGGNLRWPSLPECTRVVPVAHLRTPAHRLRHHGCCNPIRRALQQTPDEGTANTETHHHELVDSQVIHETELVVGVRLSRPVDFNRTGRLAGWRIAQVRRDAAVLAFEIADRIEGIPTLQSVNRRVQSAAGNQHEREAGPCLLVENANGPLFEELARPHAARLLRKYARHRRQGRRRGTRFQYLASDRIHLGVLLTFGRPF